MWSILGGCGFSLHYYVVCYSYLDSSEDDILGNQLPPPRLYCDICDEFDQHDTGDCPLQAQDPDDSYNTQHHAHRSHERPYCDNCESM